MLTLRRLFWFDEYRAISDELRGWENVLHPLFKVGMFFALYAGSGAVLVAALYQAYAMRNLSEPVAMVAYGIVALAFAPQHFIGGPVLICGPWLDRIAFRWILARRKA